MIPLEFKVCYSAACGMPHCLTLFSVAGLVSLVLFIPTMLASLVSSFQPPLVPAIHAQPSVFRQAQTLLTNLLIYGSS